MQEIKPGFFDRIGTSFELLKNNFLPIFLPLFIYLFITQIIIFEVMFLFFLNAIDISSLGENGNEIFLNLWSNPSVITGISGSIIFFLLYIILIIPFSIATMKAIRDGYHNKTSSLSENLIYGFMKLGSIFKVYWYVFAYTALIPSIIIIVGGLLLIIGMLGYGDIFRNIGGVIVGIGFVLLMIFMIYRGIKTSFALYNAIEFDDFEKTHFQKSLKLSKNNWWRILGNIMFFSILTSFFFSMISGMINLLFISGSIGDIFNTIGEDALSGTEEVNIEQISAILEGATDFSIVGQIKEIILLTLAHIHTIAIMVFIYVFYQRLIIEVDTGLSSASDTSRDNITL